VSAVKRTTYITGLGTFSSAGASNDAFRAALIEGGGAFTPLPEPLHRLAPGFGGVPEIDRKLLRGLPGARALRPATMTRYTLLSTFGLGLTLADAGVDEAPDEAEELARGLFVGSYVNLPEMHKQVGMSYLVRDESAAEDGRYVIDDGKMMQGMKRFTGFEFLRLMNNMPVAHGAIQARAKGPCNTFMGFCGAGLQAVGSGARLLDDGAIELAFCGGAGSAAIEHPLMYKAYRGLMSTGTDPATACRPFSRAASGIVPGEGGAFVALESEAHAAARGARRLATLRGYATGFAPPAEQRGYPADARNIADTIRAALDDAELGPADIDLLIPTGYGLPRMDALEVEAWTDVFGDHMQSTQVLLHTPVTGFCEAAHGSFGLAAALTALTADSPIRGWVPDDAVEGFPTAAPKAPPRRALVVAAAMEGTATAVVVERFTS